MKYIITITSFFLATLQLCGQESRKETFQLKLMEGWNLQSALVDPGAGSDITQIDYNVSRWYKVSVPTTLIAGLLVNNHYNFDPFYAKNLEELSDSSFDHPWWFRRAFVLPITEKGKNAILKLHGINYKANVWLNGRLIADSSTIKGPFRIFELDITRQIKDSGANVLALEILRPFNPNKKDGDLAIDYADWIHYPPDYNGGIINDVSINTYDKVGIEHPLVTTHFDLPSLGIAHLEVDADVANFSDAEEEVVVTGTINDTIRFEQKVRIAPGSKKQVAFTPTDYPQLNITNPRIWWPWQYGKQELNRIELSVIRNNKISNTISENFGIREVSSQLIDNTSRAFLINGKPIMLRGAAWSPDIFQRRSRERQEQEVKLVRDMNMNVIRSEGKMEDDSFYDLCDKYGMLVMNGWMCCGAWQYPENWNAAERNVAMASDSSVMYWLRNKACLLVWMNGSDMPPRDTTVERDWLIIEKNLKWPNPIVATADASKSKVSGYSGVKMNGPYDWVPPNYWESDSTKYGGAWSFATEISPGPSIPPYESLIKFIPADSLWYTASDWLYHTGTMTFGNTHIFDSALNERYGKSNSIKEYVAKAQAQNYEGHRAMMEAYGLKKYHTATGVVQWMLSNPWPGLIWHTYDYYLYPAGTYFGMKKSMEPLHVMYSYTSKDVYVINSLLEKFPDLKLRADLYNLDGTLKYTNSVTTTVDADGVRKGFKIPVPEGVSNTYFLRLQLKDNSNKTESINWYWLSKKKDELNWKKSKWYYTPQSSYTDFRALQKMPKTKLRVGYTMKEKGDSIEHQIKIYNTGKTVAFFVHLRLLNEKGGIDILPILFDDNYLLLAPGEQRTIGCKYAKKDAMNTATPYVLTGAWNLDIKNSTSTSGGGFAEESLGN